MEKYLHQDDERIEKFITELQLRESQLSHVVESIFEWFNKNVSYSRLNAPYSPLQRSDINLLDMKSGTCGDYSNLLVSVLMSLGYQTKYAYLKTDCYGNAQEHICVAVFEDERWKLVDATQPYRKWHGFDCPHKEYELLSPDNFYIKMKKEEAYWQQVANEWGNDKVSGVLYAPWIHEDVIIENDSIIESVLYLLILESSSQYKIYANYLVYSKDTAYSPIMCKIQNGIEYYRFSINYVADIWNEKQWSIDYIKEDVPQKYATKHFRQICKSIKQNRQSIENVMNLVK